MNGNGLLNLVPLVVIAVIIWLLVRTVRNFCTGSWLRAFVGLMGLLIVGSVFLLPAILAPNVHSHRPVCMPHLAQLGKAMKMYSMDHNGNFAMRFSELTNYANNAKLYICPTSGHLPGSVGNVDEWADYVLVAGLKESDPQASVHAFCLPEYHKHAGCNILWLDGSVQWFNAQDFAKLTNDPALFFSTSNQTQLAELKARTHLVCPTNHITRKKRWWER